MNIPSIIKGVLEEKGHTQAWVVTQMNKSFPDINMSPAKFSAIVCGDRRMQGDELIAFCKVTKAHPDIFMDDSA